MLNVADVLPSADSIYETISFVTIPPCFALLMAIVILLLHIACSYTVLLSAKSRKLDNPVYWAVVSLLAGVLALIIFFIIYHKQGEKSKSVKPDL